MKSICIFLATGFEEVEALFPLDILRRGGLSVKTVSVMGEPTVTGAHGVPVVADCLIEDLNEADIEMIVLPGGLPGATNLDAWMHMQGWMLWCVALPQPENRLRPFARLRWFMESVVC